MTDEALPLAGLRVVDLSRALAGPFCAMILADLGAEVVKIEPTPEGEMVRKWGPFKDGISVYYLSIHRNKRSLAVNFRDARGLELVLDDKMRVCDVERQKLARRELVVEPVHRPILKIGQRIVARDERRRDGRKHHDEHDGDAEPGASIGAQVARGAAHSGFPSSGGVSGR